MESEYSDRIHILSYPKKADNRSIGLLFAFSVRSFRKYVRIPDMKERPKKVVDRSALHQEEAKTSEAETVQDAPQSQQELQASIKETEKPVPETVELKKDAESAGQTNQTEPANQPYQTNKPNKKANRKGSGKRILIAIVVVILLLLAAFKVYVDNDYEPLHSMDDYQAMTPLEIESSDNVIAIQNTDAIEKKEAVGFIIYGDERVRRECYLPLMIALANQGYCVYLPTTFGNLPLLNQEGAEYVMRTYKSVKNWYMIAHGKACPVAARYAKGHASKLNGLIYLGGISYHTDLSQKDLRLLSVTGSLDTTLDSADMQNAKANDPADTQYILIEGGNHTGFIDTKLMRKDSAAIITTAEQIEGTVTAITAFLQTVTP